MNRRPQRSTRTDTRFPYATLVRAAVLRAEGAGVRVVAGCRPDAALGVSFVGSAASSVTERDIARTRRQAVQTALKRSEEHTYELQSLMRISYAVFCLKKKRKINTTTYNTYTRSVNT